VVMAASVVLVLVAGDVVVKGYFAGEAAFGEEFECAIDRREADAGIFFLDQPVQFADGKMFSRFEESLQDGVALSGVFESDAFEVLVQNLLRLASHFAGDCWLIVDAFLQHCAP